ncbi:MAG: hypothetical protein ABH813_00375 [Patescibacteria group bacterium]
MGVCSECGKSPREVHHLHPETRKPICSTCYFKLKAAGESGSKKVRDRFLNLSSDKAARWFIEKANRRDFDILLGSAETKPKAEWIFKLVSKTVVARKKLIRHLRQVGFKEVEVRNLIRI